MGGGSSSDNVGPMNLLNIRKVGYGVRSIEDLRQPTQPCTTAQPVVSATVTQPQVSIFDDNRFRNPVAATTSPVAVHPIGDDRFGGAVTTAAVTEAVVSHGDISEENVEQIIKAVLGRLNK